RWDVDEDDQGRPAAEGGREGLEGEQRAREIERTGDLLPVDEGVPQLPPLLGGDAEAAGVRAALAGDELMEIAVVLLDPGGRGLSAFRGEQDSFSLHEQPWGERRRRGCRFHHEDRCHRRGKASPAAVAQGAVLTAPMERAPTAGGGALQTGRSAGACSGDEQSGHRGRLPAVAGAAWNALSYPVRAGIGRVLRAVRDRERGGFRPGSLRADLADGGGPAFRPAHRLPLGGPQGPGAGRLPAGESPLRAPGLAGPRGGRAAAAAPRA